MKIYPIGHTSFYSANPFPKEEKGNSVASKKTLLATVATVGAIGLGYGAYCVITKKEPKTLNKTVSNAYLEEILAGIKDSKNITAEKLKSVATPEEIKNIITTFDKTPEAYSPGKSLKTKFKDGFDLSGMESGKFRANLHMHTIHSDGSLTVKELLDNSSAYADKIAPSVKDGQPPFTIAITDHDNIEGCKEAIKILAENPERYKNLKVILGCELSVESQIVTQELKKPIAIHMLIQGINPFDTKLNEFLDSKRNEKKALIETLITDIKKSLEDSKTEVSELSIEDARKFSPALKHSIIYPVYSVRDYVKSKLPAGIELPKNVREILNKNLPKLKLQDAYADMKESMTLVKSLNQGYMVIAHPGLTEIGLSVKNQAQSMEALETLIKRFKEIGGERALAAEEYYHYFGNIVEENPNWLPTISGYINKSGLLRTGGLDTHGKHFYYNSK